MEAFSALLALCAGNSPVTDVFPHKGPWRGALIFSLICAYIYGWVNNHEAGGLRRHRAHYDVIVMWDSPIGRTASLYWIRPLHCTPIRHVYSHSRQFVSNPHKENLPSSHVANYTITTMLWVYNCACSVCQYNCATENVNVKIGVA